MVRQASTVLCVSAPYTVYGLPPTDLHVDTVSTVRSSPALTGFKVVSKVWQIRSPRHWVNNTYTKVPCKQFHIASLPRSHHDLIIFWAPPTHAFVTRSQNTISSFKTKICNGIKCIPGKIIVYDVVLADITLSYKKGECSPDAWCLCCIAT